MACLKNAFRKIFPKGMIHRALRVQSRQNAGFSPAPDHVPCFSGSVSEPPGTGLWNAGCPAKKLPG